jgi:plastocyanin
LTTRIGLIGNNRAMHIKSLVRPLAALVLVAPLLVACRGTAGPAWTYAPLGPTPSADASASAAPSQGPAGSPGLALQVASNQDQPLAFQPAELTAPANTVVTVTYTNNTNLPHNTHFFDGSDQNAPSLGATKVMTGPNAQDSVTFTTPSTPGDYFFWCDVHQAAMEGTLHVTP